MELAQVRYFNAVARHGSFSAAAKALGMTQPGLTKAVRRLEASLDCALFVRLPRGVALTEQGQALLRHAGLLEVQLHDARGEVRALGRGAVGVLRIGAGPSWLSRALPRIVAELSARYPGLSFQVEGGFNRSLIEALRAGDLDLVVSALPDRSPAGLQAIALTTDTISVVARQHHPLRKSGDLNLRARSPTRGSCLAVTYCCGCGSRPCSGWPGSSRPQPRSNST